METAQKQKEKILVHICCAVCGSYLLSLIKEKFEPILYFYNPNIHPFKEYQKRKKAVEQLAKILQIEIIPDEYEVEEWFKTIKGLEKEPEGGKRCSLCFWLRLFKTAQLAQKKGIKFFTTTLAISPFKNEDIIKKIALSLTKDFGLTFLDINTFGEKKLIWQKTKETSRAYHLYHQNYCGCIFSKKPRVRS